MNHPPTEPCPICLMTERHLAYMVNHLPVTAGPALTEAQLHVLAAIASFWVRKTLAVTNGDMVALVRCLENCLRENGVDIEVHQEGMPRPQGRPS